MSTKLERSIQRNVRRHCNYPGCSRLRWRLSSCCSKHHDALRLYGHPEGRSVAPREYAKELAEVSAFIDARLSHPAVVAAVALFDRWQQRAWRTDPVPAARALQHLYQRAVTPLAMLKAACTVWLYSHRRHNRLPDDSRLTYALSLAVMRLAPRERLPAIGPGQRRYRRHDGASRRELGAHLRDVLAGFFANLVVGLNDEWRAQQQQAMDLRTPLAGTPTGAPAAAPSNALTIPEN